MKIAYYTYFKELDETTNRFCPRKTGYTFLFNKCDESVELVYADSVAVAEEALKAGKEYNKPVVCWCWDIPKDWYKWRMPFMGYVENLYRIVMNQKYVSLLKKCDLVLCGSTFTQRVLKEYGIDSVMIYGAIDTEVIDKIPEQKRKKKIVQISRFFYNKKFETTLQATMDLEGYTVVFIGSGLQSRYGKYLQKLAKKSKAHIIFKEHPTTEETIKTIKESQLLVSPSVFEGWGMTPVEALYCKTPILLSDLEVFKEVYKDHLVYHKQHDAKDMKEQIHKILGSKSVQKKILMEGQKAIEPFTFKKYSERWKRVIEEFIANNTPKK